MTTVPCPPCRRRPMRTALARHRPAPTPRSPHPRDSASRAIGSHPPSTAGTPPRSGRRRRRPGSGRARSRAPSRRPSSPSWTTPSRRDRPGANAPSVPPPRTPRPPTATTRSRPRDRQRGARAGRGRRGSRVRRVARPADSEQVPRLRDALQRTQAFVLELQLADELIRDRFCHQDLAGVRLVRHA